MKTGDQVTTGQIKCFYDPLCTFNAVEAGFSGGDNSNTN